MAVDLFQKPKYRGYTRATENLGPMPAGLVLYVRVKSTAERTIQSIAGAVLFETQAKSLFFGCSFKPN